MRIATALVAAALVLSCAGPLPDVDTDPVIAEFAQAGPFEVGHRLGTVTYEDQVWGGDRILNIQTWYPAAAPGDVKAAYGLAVIQFESRVATSDAPVSTDGPFPLIVYSHGSGGEPMLAYPYAELLASYGYVVVAAGHQGNTTGDNLLGRARPFTENIVHRPSDIGAEIDFFEDAAQAGELADITSTDRVLLFGHSFGGYTTFAAAAGPLALDTIEKRSCVDPRANCDALTQPGVREAISTGFKDHRIVAIAPQAPAFVAAFDESSFEALDVPTLMMSGRRDLTLPDEEQAQVYWAALSHPDDIWMDIPDGGHQSFITSCDDLLDYQKEQLVWMADEDGCGDDFTPPADLVPLMAGYIRRFADLHVKGLPVTGDWQTAPPVGVVEIKRHPPAARAVPRLR